MQLPLRIGADLKISLGQSSAALTPSQGLRLAEQLIRKSTRKMMVEEALADLPRRRSPPASRRAGALN